MCADIRTLDRIDRDTATLSGGETFLASLALALGLADVVTAEAAGTPMEALFVDEGFGTLDDETLEVVASTLETLAQGQRMVGVVTHVTALAERARTLRDEPTPASQPGPEVRS